MRNHRFALLLVGVVAPVFLTSCVVESENPLTNEETSDLDERLIGAWNFVGEATSDGNDMAMLIGRHRESRNTLELVGLSLNKRREVEVDHFRIFARPGKESFLSVQRIADPKDRAATWSIVRYDLPDSDTLRIFQLKTNVFQEAVRNGDLKGRIADKFTSVILEDTANAIQQFIEKNKNECFQKEPTILKKPISLSKR